jgi:hypothetical protein
MPREPADQLLAEISNYCRTAGIAESTFGRLAVNDGKLVSRLRFGGRVTAETIERVRSFISGREAEGARPSDAPVQLPADIAPKAPEKAANSGKSFRFYDNRQKYLLFVTTCGEKWVVAQRVALELARLQPRPPGLRIFDAGIGDGTVLTRVMRSIHQRFPTTPLYAVGKEISLEDVRLALEKMPDRFCEHPATVLVITNMYYSEAPWLTPNSVTAATSLVWHEVSFTGNSAHEFEAQITALQPFLAQHWRAKVGKSGNPIYEKPVVLVLYRDDYKFLLDQLRPRRGATHADYDLVIASQPYRARASVEFKAAKVVAPLVRSLAPGGRLIGIHSHGGDPGFEIIRKIWPDENPFTTDRHELLQATKTELGGLARDFDFLDQSDEDALFRYDMHALPSETVETIGTSTLFAAWNAAIYVAQIDDHRLSEVIGSSGYLDATRDVLREYGGLWFWDESYVVARKSGAA